MEGTGRFVLGGVLAVLGLLGLGLAAGHPNGGFHYIGLLIFLVCTGLLFALIAEVGQSTSTAGKGGGSALPFGPILRNFGRIREQGYEVMKTMGAIEKFVTGGVLGIFAIIALFVAARHSEGASYWGGLGFFAICIGLIFYQISGVRHSSGGDSAH